MIIDWILQSLPVLLALAALPAVMIAIAILAYANRQTKGDVGTSHHDGKRIH
jgi:hypothetical protein